MDGKKWFALMFSVLGMVCASFAQTVSDSVKIKLETSAGAEIGINGELSSTNMMTIKVPYGKHKVVVCIGNSYQKEYDIDVTPNGKTSFEFPLNGKFHVESTPKATVYIDGINHGETPNSIDLFGRHSIRVEGNNELYYPQSEVIEMSPFQELSRNYILEKRPPRKYGFLNYSYTLNHGAHSGMFGICGRWGWYMRITWIGNAMPTIDEFKVGKQSVMPSRIELEDERLFTIATGAMWRFAPWLYGYLGAGWGCYEYGYNELDGDYSGYFGVDGVAVDAGLIARWKFLTLSCGYNGIVHGVHAAPEGARFGDVYIGVGFAISGKRK